VFGKRVGGFGANKGYIAFSKSTATNKTDTWELGKKL